MLFHLHQGPRDRSPVADDFRSHLITKPRLSCSAWNGAWDHRGCHSGTDRCDVDFAFAPADFRDGRAERAGFSGGNVCRFGEWRFDHGDSSAHAGNAGIDHHNTRWLPDGAIRESRPRARAGDWRVIHWRDSFLDRARAGGETDCGIVDGAWAVGILRAGSDVVSLGSWR